MDCFPKNMELFLEFHDSDEHGETIKCECLQNCLDSNVIIEKYQHLKGTKQLLGSIGGLVIMKKYPLIRFQREVIFTLTDFFGLYNKSLITRNFNFFYFQCRLEEQRVSFLDHQFWDLLKLFTSSHSAWSGIL